jgi:hypothetical protein
LPHPRVRPLIDGYLGENIVPLNLVEQGNTEHFFIHKSKSEHEFLVKCTFAKHAVNEEFKLISYLTIWNLPHAMPSVCLYHAKFNGPFQDIFPILEQLEPEDAKN